MDLLIIINDPPYDKRGKAHDGLRLATAGSDAGAMIGIFLLGDAVYAARKGQRPPGPMPNLERMLENLMKKNTRVFVCGTCVTSRPYKPGDETGICFVGEKDEALSLGDLVAGVKMGTMNGLFSLVQEIKKVVSF